jgi:amino acid adenylation domain-containing protein
MGLLAAFQTLLSRYTNVPDVVVGAPVAGRTQPGLEGMIGMFANTVALRTDLSGDPTFRQLLSRVRSTCLGAYQHEDYPFERLLDLLGENARELSHSPVVQVLFALQEEVLKETVWAGGLRLKREPYVARVAKFDLALMLGQDDANESITGWLEYRTELFDAWRMERMVEHLRNLLSAAVTEPDQRLSRLSLLSDNERQQLVTGWNETQKQFARGLCMHDLFAKQADETPDAIAAEHHGNQLTYAELDRRSNQIARRLRRIGVGPESIVGLYLPRSLQTVEVMLAVLKAGGAYLPLDMNTPAERLRMMVEDAGVVAVVSESSTEELGISTKIVRLDLEHEEIARESVERFDSGASESNLAYIIYTSGSTGRPKGVAIEHRNAVTFLHWVKTVFSPEELASVLASTSLNFDLSIFEIFGSLSWGGKLILSENALELPRLPAAQSVSLVNTVPSAMAELMRMDALPASVMTVNLAGEPLTRELAQQVYEKPTVQRVLNLYGPSEDTTYSTFTIVPKGSPEAPTIGGPIANSQVYLLEAYELVPTGVEGEIYIGGEGLARGYLGRPELTAERLVPDHFHATPGQRLYRTGDRGRRRVDGQIEFLGRRDHQVKLRGFRIELGEIESALRDYPDVGEVVTTVVQSDGPGSGRLVAYLAPSNGSTPKPEELRRQLRQQLPEYMVPSAFVLLDQLPRTPNGKLDRRALPVPDWGAEVVENAEHAPRNVIEEMLVAIWEDVLGLKNIGIHDDFFALGGHSLLAARAVSRIRERMGVDLGVRQLFEQPTVAGLANVVTAGSRVSDASIPHLAVDGPRPISFAQRRLWFLDQFEPDNRQSYNIPSPIKLSGVLNSAALEQALKEIIRRHDILRTTFKSIDGEPMQVIAPSLTLIVPRIDLTDLDESERAPEAERLTAVEARQPFNLVTGPLIRATLVKLDEHEHRLLLTMHHIISDGWSFSVFARELAELYEAYATGSESPLAELSLQYSDYSSWQRQWLQGDVLDTQVSYWKRQLENAPQGTELPLDHPRPPVRTFRGAHESLFLPADLVSALKDLSRREGATLFMSLVATLKILLSRYTGQPDVLIGTPIANRNRSEIEDLIGFFLNTLVLRTFVEPEISFRELLVRVREMTLGAFSHQDLPFEKLLEEVPPERDLSRTPFFEVFFNMLNLPDTNFQAAGLALSVLPPPEASAKYDIALYAMDDDEQLRLDVVYNADLFDAPRMSEMLEQMAHLLTQIVADPNAAVSGYSLLTPRAGRILPDPAATLDNTWYGAVHTMFRSHVKKAPKKIAVVSKDETWTYREVDARSDRLANDLLAAGIQKEDVVAIYAHRSPALVWAILGVMKAGAVFTIIDPAYPSSRTIECMCMAQPRGWLHLGAAGPLPEELDAFIRQQKDVFILELQPRSAENAESSVPVEAPAVEIGPDDLACMSFTSGSTGKPKGILGRHGPLTHFLPWQQEAFQLDDRDRYSMFTGLAFDPLQRDIFTPLTLGATVCIPDPELISTPGWAARWMVQQEISVTMLTPTMLQLITQNAADDNISITSLRRVFMVGDVLTRSDVAKLQQVAPFVQLINFYGTTETQRAVGYYVVDSQSKDRPKHTIPLGQGARDVQLLLLNSAGKVAGVGELGEVYIRSPHIARGYLGNPELTRERFLVNPYTSNKGDRIYKTGDLGRYLPDANVEFGGRNDFQVKIRGFRIELGEVEAALKQHPAVMKAAVLANDDAALGKILVAYVVPGERPGPTAGELRRFMQERVPIYMIPATFVTLDEMPVTPNGKVDQRALPAPTDIARESSDGPADGSVGPRTWVEEVLTGIWTDLLGVANPGVEENFFELGGHSLLATQAAARIHQAFGMEIPLRAFFERPTPAMLAEYIEEALGTARQLPYEPVPRTGRETDLPLSFAQQRLWFFDQLEPGNWAYNISSAVRLTGQLNVPALEGTFSEIVRRHESLRTTFSVVDNSPIQVVSAPSSVPLTLIDLSALPEPEREAEARLLAESESRRPFDLSRGPMLRVVLLKLAEQEHIALLTMHHIISDGWSLGVLVREVVTLYEAYAKGEPSPLAELNVQYADFAVWQRERLQGEFLDEALSYWRDQLTGAPRLLELPTDRPRSARQSYHGSRLTFEVNEELSAKLRDLSRREGVTLFMLLLAAWQFLLSRYSGQQDIVVGAAIANRNRTDIEDLIGFFVNTLALRVRVPAEENFLHLLARVRDVTLGAYKHQELPFERIVEELQPERVAGSQPLFQVMFVYQNMPASSHELPGLTLGQVEMSDDAAVRSDIDFYLWEGESLRGSFIYSTELFDESTIEQMIGRLLELLEEITRAPEVSLTDLLVSAKPEPLELSLTASGEEEAPFSYHQERLWFIDQFENGKVYESAPTYHNIPLILHLKGNVDTDVLESSLNEIVQRHSVLRTRFIADEDERRQVITRSEQIELNVVQCMANVAEAVELALIEARKPFALDADLPIRATIYRLPVTDVLLLLTVHHIVADRQSLQLIATELAEIYNARMEGRTASLPEIPVQYANYAQGQQRLAEADFAQLWFYWKWQLRGHLAALKLPEDRPRPAIHTYTAARETVTVDGTLIRCLAGGDEQFAAVLAAFKVLMHRYARQDEIVVGTSEPCRTQPEVANVVGPFANLVVLRSDLGGNPSFSTLVSRVQKTVAQARAHQEMPFDKLVQLLNPEKDMSRTALFDVLFQFDDEAEPVMLLGNTHAQQIDTNFGYGKYDLNVLVRRNTQVFTVTAVYNADIYDSWNVRQMLRHFAVLINTFASDSEQRIDDVALLSTVEEQQQLYGWNETHASYPADKTIHQLFAEQAARTPENIAVTFGDENVTYRELDERANRLAHYLRRQGVGPNQLVALCLNKSPEMIVSLLAVLKAGGAYLPLDPSNPVERLQFVMEDSSCTHLITTSSLVDNVPVKVPATVLLDADREAILSQPSTAPDTEVRPQDLAYCIYTSGSTGKPKGALLEHRNVVRLLVNDRLQFTFTSADVWTMFHSYSFDFSVWEMYGALLYGGRLVLVPEAVAKDPVLFLDLLVNEKVTVLNQTPTAFYNLASVDRGESLALRYVIFGGEALRPALLREWRAAHPHVKLINMYGITETTVHVTFKEIDDEQVANDTGNIGVPIPTTTTYILDDGLRLLPVGVPGEICVGGDGVCRGYLGRDELTRRKFIANPYKPEERIYRSGDVGKLLPSGEMVYMGRNDDQVQIRGFRVEPGEVQSQLLTHPLITRAEVIAKSMHHGAVELVAYVVATGSVDVTELRAHIAKTLPHYMVPSAFVFIDAMPLTPNGKVDRAALPAPDMSGVQLERTFVAPRTPEEEVIAAIWKELLGYEEVSVHDNFFDLGGHSLLATQVVSRVRDSLHAELTLAALFESPTVAGLAEAALANKSEPDDFEDILAELDEFSDEESAVY